MYENTKLRTKILLLDSEGPDLTVRKHRLIWAFSAHICSGDIFSLGAAHMAY